MQAEIFLFASENEGASWTQLSGDLTTNDKGRQKPSGGPITKDNTGVETYCTIFTATESALEKDLLWTGSDDGLIHVSQDGGKNWTNVTPAGIPKWMMWNCVETDPFVKGKAYFVGTRYKSDDFAPYIFKTEDYGKTWKQITNGIPSNHFTRCIRADRKRPGLLYCGTEYGMYISYDDGATWKSFQLNLPKVPITDLCLKENDLIVSTQGRAIWILNDLGVLQQYDPSNLQKNIFIYDIVPAYPYNGYQNLKAVNSGINPPNGVVMNYFVKEMSDSATVTITIRNSEMRLIRSFSNKGGKEDAPGKILKIEAEKGMNQFVWDMHWPNPVKIEGMIFWDGMNRGPKAAPGKYFVSIKVGKDSVENSFEIKVNPTYKSTVAEQQAKEKFLLKVSDKFNEVQKTIISIRSLRAQINSFTSKSGKDCPKEIKAACDSLSKQLTLIEEALYQTKLKSGQDMLNYPMKLNNKLSSLYNYVDGAETAPNQQAQDAYAEIELPVNAELSKFNSLLSSDLNKLNKMISEKALPLLLPEKDQ